MACSEDTFELVYASPILSSGREGCVKLILGWFFFVDHAHTVIVPTIQYYRTVWLGTQSHTLTSLDFTSWYFTAANSKSCFGLFNSFFLSSNNVSVVILSSCSWVILAFSCSIIYFNITSLQDYYTTSMLPCPSHRQLTVVVKSALTHHHVYVPVRYTSVTTAKAIRIE